MVDPDPQPGAMVTFTELPAGFLDDLPSDDQKAISSALGKPVRLNEYDENGRAELEFTDSSGTFHFIYLDPRFIKAVI
jgi:hypothetical protein